MHQFIVRLEGFRVYNNFMLYEYKRVYNILC